MPPEGTPGAGVPPSADEALVRHLVEVIAGRAPMADAERLLAPGVICHMDRWTVRGTQIWFDWLNFLLSKSKGSVTADIDLLVSNPDGTITAFGWLRAGHGESTRQRHHATYRVENERIAEIWTTRENYEMIFGAKVRHSLRWLLVLLEMAVWRRLPWTRHARSSPQRGGVV